MNQSIDLRSVWRDKLLLSDIESEIKAQSQSGWKAWEILLPPDLLYPMISEISEGMYTVWSPALFGVGIQVGAQNEIAMKFVLPDLKTSPVKVQTKKYIPSKADDIIPVGVNV